MIKWGTHLHPTLGLRTPGEGGIQELLGLGLFLKEKQAVRLRTAHGEAVGPAGIHTAVLPVSTASLRSFPVSVEGSSGPSDIFG